MNLMHSKALEANKLVRNLELDEALRNLMEHRPLLLEQFQQEHYRVVLEYLLALSDRIKDDFFAKKDTNEVEKAFITGKLEMIDELVGLGSFLKSYKTKEQLLKELEEKQRAARGGD